jgi:hypothetical protein
MQSALNLIKELQAHLIVAHNILDGLNFWEFA